MIIATIEWRVLECGECLGVAMGVPVGSVWLVMCVVKVNTCLPLDIMILHAGLLVALAALVVQCLAELSHLPQRYSQN